jgi:hypothetical protein
LTFEQGIIVRTFLISVFVLALHNMTAHGQAAPAASLLNDAQVRSVLMLALDKIGSALCTNTRPCAPATEEEKANPPVSIPEARSILGRAVLSGVAEKCGFNWRDRSFLPMMQHWRQTMKKNERQMALIGMIHGLGMGLANQAECSPQLRENVDRQLTFKP